MPALDLQISLRLDALSLTCALLVSGVGALVLLYCAWYFAPTTTGLGRLRRRPSSRSPARCSAWSSPTTCSLLYVFWELTTVFSYLLIGHDPTGGPAGAAALQALIVTTLGGLAMLVGFSCSSGSGRHLPARRRSSPTPPGSGTLVAGAVLLLLVGALTQVGDQSRSTSGCPGDGRAHPGQRLPARGGDGEGRHLPGRPARPGVRRRRVWRPIVLGARRGHHAPRRLARRCASTTSSCCWPTAPSASSAS